MLHIDMLTFQLRSTALRKAFLGKEFSISEAREIINVELWEVAGVINYAGGKIVLRDEYGNIIPDDVAGDAVRKKDNERLSGMFVTFRIDR